MLQAPFLGYGSGISVHNDPRSEILILDSKPESLAGTVKGFSATLRNTGQQNIIAYEIVWSLTLTNGCRTSATTSSDMLLTGNYILPGATLAVASTVGGWPVDAVDHIVAEVSYYQLSDRSTFDRLLTSISEEIVQRRAKSAEIFGQIQAAAHTAVDADQAITEVLSDPVLANDRTAALPLMELRGLYKAKGSAAVMEYVRNGIAQLKH
jgi:hypothetical protein